MQQLFSHRLQAIALLGAIALLTPVAMAKDVSGKVVGVFVEPVTVNNRVLDKVSVTVSSCQGGGLQTVSYLPGLVSEDNALGFLFNQQTQAARAAVTKNQYMNMVSGHVSFVADDKTNTVQKTTFWGYNWECGKNVDTASGAAAGGGAATPSATPATPTTPARPGGGNPLMRRIPGF
jgi:hypothetical protein